MLFTNLMSRNCIKQDKQTKKQGVFLGRIHPAFLRFFGGLLSFFKKKCYTIRRMFLIEKG